MQQLFLKRLSALVATLTVAVLFSGSLLAAGKDGSATELASLLKSYETYQADFIQIVVSENGNNVQETRGLLKAKRPGLFYWETRAPLSQLVVSDGKSVEVYDTDRSEERRVGKEGR